MVKCHIRRDKIISWELYIYLSKIVKWIKSIKKQMGIQIKKIKKIAHSFDIMQG